MATRDRDKAVAEKLEEIRPELENLADSDLPIADLAQLALDIANEHR